MNEVSLTARKPWVAAVLSLFCTGLGHIYCGRIVVGLVLFLATLLFVPVMVVVAFLAPSTPLLIALILCVLLVPGVYLAAAVDAYRVARAWGNHRELREYNRGFVYALFILVGVTYPALLVRDLRANYFEAFFIAAPSGTPNILQGDRVLVNKAALRGQFPRRGDAVNFHPPNDRRLVYLKRVIALPGDTIALRANQVYVNGKPLGHDPVPAANLASIREIVPGQVFSESNAGRRYLTVLDRSAQPTADYPERTVPDGTCFVLGDNRNHSEDSRQFGFVPMGDIVGIVQYIYFPTQSWSRFGAFRE